MTTAAEYRAMADECFQCARVAKTDNVRSAYLEIAKIWLAAADVRQDGESPIRDPHIDADAFSQKAGRQTLPRNPLAPAPAHHEKPPAPTMAGATTESTLSNQFLLNAHYVVV
jgi:hypothetical protein